MSFAATLPLPSVAMAGPSATGGVLYAFGNNDSGELGIATNNGTDNPNPTPTPVQVPARLGAVTRVAAGGNFSLAVTSKGRLYTFGSNYNGQLGIVANSRSGRPDPTLMPVTLPGGIGAVKEVAAGESYGLAVTASGQLYGFGNNDSGELGNTNNNGTFNPNPTPTPVVLPGRVGTITQVSAGVDHTLAVTASGQLYGFGYNGGGELGNATNDLVDVANPTPTLITLPGQVGAVTQVAAGGFHSLAATASGQLYAFGDNDTGELGTAANSGTFHPNPTPVLVTLPGQVGPVKQIAAGYAHSLAVTSGGQVYAFGNNDFGQLGIATNSSISHANPTPVLVTLPGQVGAVKQIAAGYSHSIVVTMGGQLYTFGDNDSGQLGIASNSGTMNPVPTPTPVRLPQGTRIDAVAQGPTSVHTLAIVSGSPVVTRLTESHSRWREANQRTRLAKRRHSPVGTTFSFTLTQQAVVRFAFTQQLTGRRINSSCVGRHGHNVSALRCKLAVSGGTLSIDGRSGANTVAFGGRVSSSKKLMPGRYTVMVTAANAAGQRSERRSLSFAIIR